MCLQELGFDGDSGGAAVWWDGESPAESGEGGRENGDREARE